uniref:Type I-D CRISPR-associated protein Cas5/Csc1 n=1 Tax=candidate division WOR-3 bacterium TaxID=2052148 RepID=A0A7C4U6N1_UNCW3
MYKIYLYQIKLVDPLFYSREGLSASFTPPYLHATAVNFAVKNALNIDPHEQPYIISEENGISKDNPRYKNSLISNDFYFTPARLITPLKYFSEITKGENDGFIFTTKQGEPLQAGTLNYISPESIFEGFLVEKRPYKWPKTIRLGSFRGKAVLKLNELEILKIINSNTVVSHPVDPLVTVVKKGIAIAMFPYPIIENAECSICILAKLNTYIYYKMALPQEWKLPTIDHIKISKNIIVL